MVDVFKSMRSFKFALKGIRSFFKTENNARIHFLASLVVIVLGFYFQLNRSEWLWIVLAIALVWITEMVNTAFEKLVDLVSPQKNTQAGQVKDLAAGAVLLAATAAVVIAVLIFGPYLF
ncbi:diacylglycerol kinase family protein [Bdellovibrio sp. HCB337]|uniref:diacylglycerol kinase family protein n=1 Tax=Bdellovibrio sp. HCB337 TaxID=3394358 RepID=UPI0039A53C0A